MNTTHQQYRETQDGIYAKIAAAQAEVGVTDTLHNDVAVPQGAFLVAWRHPESITAGVEEVSLAVASVAQAVTYGRHNLHTTLSDHGLTPNLVINPAVNSDHEETLDALARSVHDGLDATGFRVANASRVAFDRYITNGKAVIAPGQGNDEFLDINAAVKAASATQGIADGNGLKGAWGAHMTVNRFAAESTVEAAADVVAMLDQAAEIGVSNPIAIDVGYLAVSAEEGFVFTTHERFPIVRE